MAKKINKHKYKRKRKPAEKINVGSVLPLLAFGFKLLGAIAAASKKNNSVGIDDIVDTDAEVIKTEIKK